jgi:hypothetical protein
LTWCLSLSADDSIEYALLVEDADAMIAVLGDVHVIAADRNPTRILELTFLGASRAKCAHVLHIRDVVHDDAPIDVVGDKGLTLGNCDTVWTPQFAVFLRAVRPCAAEWLPVCEGKLLDTMVATLNDKKVTSLARDPARTTQLSGPCTCLPNTLHELPLRGHHL